MRASPFDVGEGVSITMCSAEDLVVHKAFAGRAQDWLDIESIVARQGARLDSDLVIEEVRATLGAQGVA